MKNSKFLLLFLLFYLYSGNTLQAANTVVATEIGDPKTTISVTSHTFNLSTQIALQIQDDSTNETYWLDNEEKPTYLYNSAQIYTWLSDNKTIESNPQNSYILKTVKGTAIINPSTGILTYRPNVNASGTDEIYFKLKCLSCEDNNQKTLALRFSMAQKGELTNSLPLLTVDNYPNPCTNKTTIQYVLDKDANIQMYLYDALGSLLKIVQSNEQQAAGRHSFELEVENLPTGILYLLIQSEEQQMVQRISKL